MSLDDSRRDTRVLGRSGQTLLSWTGRRNQLIEVPATRFERAASLLAWADFRGSSRHTELVNDLKRYVLKRRRRCKFPASEQVFFGKYQPGKPWAIYFIYCPESVGLSEQKESLKNLRDQGFNILAVCASERDSAVLDEFRHLVDAMIWKELQGYDFSAYLLGARLLVDRFGSVDSLLLNDSVLGPYTDVMPLMEHSPWRVAGLTSARSVQDHFQSYCLLIKGLDAEIVSSLEAVISESSVFDSHRDVVFFQETSLAHVMAKRFTAGSILAPLHGHELQIVVGNPEGLSRLGFPFIKKSIFGKFSKNFNQEHYRAILAEMRKSSAQSGK